MVTQQESRPAPPAARPKNPTKPERWNEIVDAAGHVFNEKGYQAARIEDIAARVGLLKGSLYYYIDSKEDLLYAITDSGHDKGLTTIDEDAETRAADPPTRLGAFIARWMSIMPSNPEYASVAERDVRLLSDERQAAVMEKRNRIHHFVRRIIEQGIAEGYFDASLDAGVATNSLFDLLNSSTRWFRPTGRLTYEDLIAYYRAFVLKGLRAEPEV